MVPLVQNQFLIEKIYLKTEKFNIFENTHNLILISSSNIKKLDFNSSTP